jgi:hypothetical protein
MIMKFEQVFQILDEEVAHKLNRHLKDVEKFVLERAWQDQTYEEMAASSNYQYTYSYLKQGVGPRLWQTLRKTIGEKVSKTNFRAALERWVQIKFGQNEDANNRFELNKSKLVDLENENREKVIKLTFSYDCGENWELLKLSMMRDCDRLAKLLGINESDRTILSINLTKSRVGKFECLLQYKLKNSPLVEDMLKDTILFFVEQQNNMMKINIGDDVNFHPIVSIGISMEPIV